MILCRPSRQPQRGRPRLVRLEDRTTPTAGAIYPVFGTNGTVNFNFAWTDDCYAGEVDRPVGYSIVTGTVVSGDLNYNGLNPADVSVTNQDNDPIWVTNIAVNGGASQRSMVKGITVTFGQV